MPQIAKKSVCLSVYFSSNLLSPALFWFHTKSKQSKINLFLAKVGEIPQLSNFCEMKLPRRSSGVT